MTTGEVCRLLLLACLMHRLASPVHAACGSISQASIFTSGSVTSHSTFGSSFYSPNMNCQWVVTLPSSTTYVSVTVISLSLGEGDCIRVLRYSDNAELTSVCDGTATGTLITLTSQGIIRFTSDSSGQAAGFRLTLSLTKSPDCTGHKYMYSSSGSISSHPNVGLSGYSNSMRCYWHIRVPAGKFIRATFITASLESGYDKVFLYDGSSLNFTSIVAVSGAVAHTNYDSTSRYMTVKFHTGRRNSNKTGFRMTYQAARDEPGRDGFRRIVAVAVTCFVLLGFVYWIILKTFNPAAGQSRTAVTMSQPSNLLTVSSAIFPSSCPQPQPSPLSSTPVTEVLAPPYSELPPPPPYSLRSQV